MAVRRHALLRCGYPLVCILAGLALGSCVHPDGHKDLLAFLQDGTTTKKEVETRIGPASIWREGRIWTYRVGEATEGFYLSEKTYGPPRPQEVCASRSDRSASTYPVSELPLRPRWSSRALVLISAAASMRHFFHQGSRAPVQPSGHLAFTTRRFQQPPAPDGCSAADLLYAIAGWSPIVAL